MLAGMPKVSNQETEHMYQLDPARLAEIEEDLGDDDSGWLIKSSTLKWLIEREVNRELSKVSKQKTASTFDAQNCQEYTDACRLLDLSDRILRIPVMYGTDQSDYDELRAIAARLSEQAVTDHLAVAD